MAMIRLAAVAQAQLIKLKSCPRCRVSAAAERSGILPQGGMDMLSQQNLCAAPRGTPSLCLQAWLVWCNHWQWQNLGEWQHHRLQQEKTDGASQIIHWDNSSQPGLATPTSCGCLRRLHIGLGLAQPRWQQLLGPQCNLHWSDWATSVWRPIRLRTSGLDLATGITSIWQQWLNVLH